MQISGEVGGKKREQLMQRSYLESLLVSSEVRGRSVRPAESSREEEQKMRFREVRIRSGARRAHRTPRLL